MKVRWNEDEDNLLIQLYKKGWAWVEIAYRLNTVFSKHRTAAGCCQRFIQHLQEVHKVKKLPRGPRMATQEALTAQSRLEGRKHEPSSQIKLVKGAPAERETPRVKRKYTRKAPTRVDLMKRPPSYPAQLAKLARNAEALFNVVEVVRAAAADNRTIHDVVEDLMFLNTGTA
jgi:ABC-type Fe2+-enterobactin transport system substrate-binding protein